jgi:hypothetical protein
MKKELLTKPFPREMIRQRQGAHGQTLNYVEAHAVIARLNEVSDFVWHFEAIHAHARRRGIALPELGAMLLERTGKGEPQSLTRREASGVLDVLSSANGTHR